ncbi:anionic antimicrobial peptide 2-like [Achroia grisella]|uniref:anionic antimicrobial peptide 2-like n=1 Tax=Achroia grisella TaxID=688607 RepID=UPI0027D2BBA3|nr:anionic antimicrobial peptide 2-like [Achroia grisella]
MNKLLIVLLAVCLVNVHAFVKRDTATPAASDDILKNLQKQFEEASKNFGTQVQNALDSDKIKKDVNDFIENLSKTLKELGEKKETPK